MKRYGIDASRGRLLVMFGGESVAANNNYVNTRLREADGTWADVHDLGSPATNVVQVKDVLLRDTRALLFYGNSAVPFDITTNARGDGQVYHNEEIRGQIKASANFEQLLIAIEDRIGTTDTDGVILRRATSQSAPVLSTTEISETQRPLTSPIVVPLADGTAWLSLVGSANGGSTNDQPVLRFDGTTWSAIPSEEDSAVLRARTFFDAVDSTHAVLGTGPVLGDSSSLYVFDGATRGPAIDVKALGRIVGGKLVSANDLVLCTLQEGGLYISRGAPTAMPAATSFLAYPAEREPGQVRCVVNADGDVAGFVESIGNDGYRLDANTWINGTLGAPGQIPTGSDLSFDVAQDETGNFHIAWLNGQGNRVFVVSYDSGVTPDPLPGGDPDAGASSSSSGGAGGSSGAPGAGSSGATAASSGTSGASGADDGDDGGCDVTTGTRSSLGWLAALGFALWRRRVAKSKA